MTTISRRNVAKGALWSAPAIIATSTIPAYAASPDPVDICSYKVTGLTSRDDANAQNNKISYFVKGAFVGNPRHPEVKAAIEIVFFNPDAPAPVISSTSGNFVLADTQKDEGSVRYSFRVDEDIAPIDATIQVQIDPSYKDFVSISLTSDNPACDSYTTYLYPNDDIYPGTNGAYLVQGSTLQLSTGEGQIL